MRADARKNYDHLLDTARVVVAEQGADASLRDIARRAGVVVGTLYRHFPTRETLLDALLRSSFDTLTGRAVDLEASAAPREALLTWMRETYDFTRTYRGVTEVMATAMDDPSSALHASCMALKDSGARLLAQAQKHAGVRTDFDAADMLGLIAAFAWLATHQRGMDRRGDELYELTAAALLDGSV